MRRLLIALAAIACLVGAGRALADLTYTQGSGTTIFDFVCFTTKHCSAHTNITSTGTEIFTTAAPAQVSLANTGANATAVKVDGSGATQPVSGTLTANQGTSPWVGNTTQLGGASINLGAGAVGSGTQRITQASDSPEIAVLGATGASAGCGTTNTVWQCLFQMDNDIKGTGNVQGLGTAGSPTGGVLTVQGAVSMTPFLNTNQAGEAHVGEVGGNQIAVQVAQTVTASSAYTSGNAVGGLITVANAARVSGALGASGTGGILQNVAINSKSVQSTSMELWVFNANPAGSTCTDKSAFVLATADFDKVIGVVSVPGTAANNSGWFSGGTGSVGQGNNQAMAYDLSSATSLFACLVTRATPTFTATSDISVKLNLLRN